MTGAELLALITTGLTGLGAAEYWYHRRNLDTLKYRIHVNGTRGKSSVTRLIAAALRESGLTTCAKTTGTLARMILPDGRELPVFRPSGANVIEQTRIVSTARAYGAEALVIECMALQPEYQSLCEFKMVRATHGVITNARPDHLDVMGPGAADVARALSGMVPVGAKLFTAERENLDVIRAACDDRGTELFAVGEEEAAAVTAEELDGFAYTEHAENVALAIRVCEDLGIERADAVRGMWAAKPDPGAMTEHLLDFFGRRVAFVNGFAANDPVSTERIWNMANERFADYKTKIAIFNCRGDRPDRSLQLGSDFAKWSPADYVMLMGTGTYIFARSAAKAGVDPARLVLTEGLRVDEIFERVISLVDGSALVMGMGNIGGQGIDLVRYFDNRAERRLTR